MTVCSVSLLNVTLYTRPKSTGHALRCSSLMPLRSRPKSSLTELVSSASSVDDLPKYSQRELRAKPCWESLEQAPVAGGGPKFWNVFSKASLPPSTRAVFGSWTYRENDRDTTADGLVACQVCSFADPQVLRLSSVALPAGDGSSEEVHLDALTRRQRRNNLLAAALASDVDLCGGAGALGRVQSGGTVGAFNHCELCYSGDVTAWNWYCGVVGCGVGWIEEEVLLFLLKL